jgi:hypothetical protein
MNDLEACGTSTAMRRHSARAELCVECEPDVEWLHRCPHCFDRVPVKGTTIQPHDREGTDVPCTGAGHRVPPPPLTVRPIFSYDPNARPWRRSPEWVQWFGGDVA